MGAGPDGAGGDGEGCADGSEPCGAGGCAHVVGIMRVAKDGAVLTTTTHQGASQDDVSVAVGRSGDTGSSEGGEEHACPPSRDVSSAPDTSALPWFHLVLVMLSVASDAFALMGPLPFLPQLCVAQYGLAEADVGYYVGVFTGAYSIANFCTSVISLAYFSFS